MSLTKSICRIPLVGCLLKASEYKEITENWLPVNEQQESFKRHLDFKNELNCFLPEEFASIASTNKDEINKWFQENDFSIQCPDIEEGGFATASMVKLIIEWLSEAETIKLTANNNKVYDYIEFNKIDGKNITFNNHEWNMVKLRTKDEKTNIFITSIGDNGENISNLDDESLLTLVKGLQAQYHHISNIRYEGVKLPMVNLNTQINHDWIKGMKADEFFVQSCLQQFVLKLNEKGAMAKSAAVMTFTRSAVVMNKKPLIFDKPFMIWFQRKGVTYPAFLSVCDYDCWQNPGDLG
jgi:hypothetical protein